MLLTIVYVSFRGKSRVIISSFLLAIKRPLTELNCISEEVFSEKKKRTINMVRIIRINRKEIKTPLMMTSSLYHNRPSLILGSSLAIIYSPRGVGWVLPYWGQYGYVPRENPPIFTLEAPKDSTFATCAARKDPPFQKMYVSLSFLAPKPHFSSMGQCWKPPPPFSVRGRSVSPLFLNPPWHIYTTLIFEYPLFLTIKKMKKMVTITIYCLSIAYVYFKQHTFFIWQGVSLTFLLY